MSVSKVSGYTTQQITYHLGLLKQAGLIDALSAAGEETYGTQWLPQSITWEGHEFLDAARGSDRWSKAKSLAREKGGALTFEAVKTALTEGTKRALFDAIAAGA